MNENVKTYIAELIDGQHEPDHRHMAADERRHPDVNPHAHIAVRQRHFHHAAAVYTRLWYRRGRRTPNDGIDFDRLQDAHKAFKNCEWRP